MKSNFISNFSDAILLSNKISLDNNIDSQRKWKRWHSENKECGLPNDPSIYYKEWISWMHWLGIKKLSNKDLNKSFLSFDDAREYVRNLKFKSTSEWKEWEKPSFIPSLPYITYKEQWISWYDWLGYSNQQNKSFPIRKIASVLEINNINYILEKRFILCKNFLPLPFDVYLPDNNILIEYDGEHHYQEINIFGGKNSLERRKVNDKIKNDFCLKNNIELIRISYIDKNNILEILKNYLKINLKDSLFLGDIKSRKNFLNYRDAKRFIKNNLKELNFESYRKWIKKNNIDFLPLDPRSYYRNNFEMNDYLSKEFYTYEQAQNEVLKMNINSKIDWKKYYKQNRNYNMPKCPEKFYKEWINWEDFLKIKNKK